LNFGVTNYALVFKYGAIMLNLSCSPTLCELTNYLVCWLSGVYSWVHLHWTIGSSPEWSIPWKLTTPNMPQTVDNTHKAGCESASITNF